MFFGETALQILLYKIFLLMLNFVYRLLKGFAHQHLHKMNFDYTVKRP